MQLCRFRPDASRGAEFLSALWQGEVPPDLILHKWLYVDTDPREVVLLWEGGEDARRWVERSFGEFGSFSSETVTDSTGGLAACLARDLEGFGAWMRSRSSAEADITSQLELRRRGLEAGSRDKALAAGRAWAAEQSR